ncbi:MAG: TonB-dependent receptor [Dysgonomonas sp.]|nr:TonB-dependent receptor [Dysgonomonas sp.]
MNRYSHIKVCLLMTSLFSVSLFAKEELPKDTLYTELKNDIVILSTTKETNSLKYLPASVSVFSPKNLEALQVTSLKDLSAIVPNYFAADYGSKMTAPIYIRGIGARSGDQTVSVYIDNIPYFNTTSFDSELYDIQRIEVLRGTQGTLYGRNAMGGILNIYTYSPLSYEGTTIKVGGGSYGLFSANASRYQPLNNKMGLSVSAYYKQDNGYFTNHYTGKKADDLKNAGGRIKYVWDKSPRLSLNYSLSFDYVNQGAFPYANVETGDIDYDSEGYYKRKLFTNGLVLRYTGENYEINSTTGYQYLNDDMNMDQDYTPLSLFQINQKQRQNSLSQEITVKSRENSDYQWSFGGYGFYDYLNNTPPVYMMKDGVQRFLQAPMDAMDIPVTYTDDQIDLNGEYKRPVYGAAVFHQSTFNNILNVKGLSATFGLRLDYEKTKLDYNANTSAGFDVNIGPGMPPMSHRVDTAIVGSSSSDYLELLPKGVLKYQLNNDCYIYASASRGYKAGGHNIQIFADLLQEVLAAKMMGSMPGASPSNDETPIKERISYKPEYSWNYELGGQIHIIENTLTSNFALYYMDVRDVQITQFIKSGGGRLVSNAGKAISKGFEVGLKTRPCNGFYLYTNYGFADAEFKDNKIRDKDGGIINDYTGNQIPFAPRYTFSIGGSISYDLKNSKILDRVTFDTNFAGIGKVYWAEDNMMSQGFYGTLNAHLALDKNIFTLEVWGKNILDRDYNTFLFESMGDYFAQKGKPMRWGASLKIKL